MNFIDDFGCLVFNENIMKKRLPKNIYLKLKQTIHNGYSLNNKMCDVIANEMKIWAMEHGATHFSHWFQPFIGNNFEKLESFFTQNDVGNIIANFSGKELIKGEPDASSFPSGGLRSTFEARGYTIWEPTSFAFIRDKTLYIPAVFCSYHGEILDNKIPLLKSMELINKHALRILKLLGNSSVKRVVPTVGAEQEYFLIDKSLYEKHEDLKNCKRTLFGIAPTKSQEASSHYFSKINPRVSAFMSDLDAELWKLGILAKTKHNEVAPAQHELAPFFTEANIAFNQNQIIMDCMKTVAERHNFYCLLHEKPFDGFNGSGKHINWSLSADNKKNLFDLGYPIHKNTEFLLFLCAVIKGVDEFQDLLVASGASAGNDLRLGSDEAPGSIMSIFLGNELTEILNNMEIGKKCQEKTCPDLELKVKFLPKLKKDSADRNRTSPFAFTDNKFEFRMLGASSSIAFPVTVINTIVAEELCQFANILECSSDINSDLNKIIAETMKHHKQIIFNGDNYSEDWLKEAKKRGISSFKNAVEAISPLISKKNIELFEKHKIYSKTEIFALYNVLLQNYIQTLSTEAEIMISMAKKQIIPATTKYIKCLGETLSAKKQTGNNINCKTEILFIKLLSTLSSELYQQIEILEKILSDSEKISFLDKRAQFLQHKIFPAMRKIRKISDKIELNIDKELWPLLPYSEILFHS